MNCQQVDKYLYDYCDNLLTPDQMLRIEEHLEHCPRCREVVDKAQLESSVLREEWDTPALSPDFTSQVMERVATISISTTGNLTQPDIKGHNKWSRWLINLTAAAAILLAVLYIPGMVKNQSFINLAIREQAVPESVNDEMINPEASTKEVGGLGLPVGVKWSEENNEKNEQLANSQNKSAPLQENDSSPAQQEKSAPVRYAGRSETALKDTAPMAEPLTLAGLPETKEVFPVQPVNIPSSYRLLDKIDNIGSCTYIFTTAKAEEAERLTINIAQLPLHQQVKSTYSRAYIRESASPLDNNKKSQPSSGEQSSDNSQNLTVDSPDGNEIKIATDEQTKQKADIITTVEQPNSISYEVEYNNQRYLLTINATISPEELTLLSQDLRLTASNP